MKQAFNQDISRQSFVSLLVAQTLVVLPLFFQLAVWLPLVWLFVLVWRIQIYRGVWRYPSSSIKMLLSAGVIAGLVVSYSAAMSVAAMVAFLIVSALLKLLEVQKRDDVRIILLVNLFIIASLYLFYQGMLAGVYGIFSLWITLSAWMILYRSTGLQLGEKITQQRSISWRRDYLQGGTLILQALPIMLILFIAVPRLNPLWQMPMPTQSGVTGFSGKFAPGDVSQLAQSSETAFRVEFNKGTPQLSQSQLYWRGLVLEYFDGREWHAAAFHGEAYLAYLGKMTSASKPHSRWKLDRLKTEDSDVFSDQILDYQVLLEPHHQHWLFSLDTPVKMASPVVNAGFSSNRVMMARHPIYSRMQYSVSSDLDALSHKDTLSESERRTNIRLPKNSNPQAKLQASRWQIEAQSDEAYIQKVLQNFTQLFSYTLQPQLLGANSVDDFLFQTQAGFCEHFASSFVFLMRAAGIPARIVLGYQGGAYNAQENFYLVRQSDAHAWAEVWLQGKGWTRVDPTAAVAPERIEGGVFNALSGQDASLISGTRFSGALFTKIQLFWESVDYQWNRLIVGYDGETQLKVLTKLLGELNPLRMAVFMVGGITFFILLFLSPAWYRRLTQTRTFSEKAYTALLKRFRKLGGVVAQKDLTKVKSSNGITFTAMIEENESSLRNSKQIKVLYKLYEKAVYAGDSAYEEKFWTLLKRLK